MQQQGKIRYDLSRLILDLSDRSDAEIEAIGRKYYADSMLDVANKGIRQTHDDQELHFWKHRFDHSCFISPAKILVDKGRVARLPWILPIVAGNIADTECRAKQNIGRSDNRAYICIPENFVIWLEPRDEGGWRYSSHYPADRNEIRLIQRNSRKIASF
jgi:hypothetical protein